MTSAYCIYHAPYGSPSPLMVVRWDYAPGIRPVGHDPMPAADREQADALVPPGLTWESRRDAPGEPPNLIGTWRPK